MIRATRFVFVIVFAVSTMLYGVLTTQQQEQTSPVSQDVNQATEALAQTM